MFLMSFSINLLVIHFVSMSFSGKFEKFEIDSRALIWNRFWPVREVNKKVDISDDWMHEMISTRCLCAILLVSFAARIVSSIILSNQ